MFQIHKHFRARISLFGGNPIFLGAKLAAGRCDPLDRRRRNADRLSRLPASPLLSAAANPSGPRRDPKAAAHRPCPPAVAFQRVRRIERDSPTDQRTLADIGVDRDADGAALAAHGKRLCHGFFPIRPNCAQKTASPPSRWSSGRPTRQPPRASCGLGRITTRSGCRSSDFCHRQGYSASHQPQETG